MTDRRIVDLQEGLSNDAYLLTDSVTNGTKKYAVSDMIDRAADTALNEVNQIISQASSAAAQATDAKNAAQAATTAANNAANAANDATAAANAAIDAIGDISEQTVPIMSNIIRGGAKLGNGLSVENDFLSLGPLVKSGDGSSMDGCAIASLNGEGWAEQVTTTGKNLLPELEQGGINADGINRPSSWEMHSRRLRSVHIPVSANTTYVMGGECSVGTVSYGFYYYASNGVSDNCISYSSWSTSPTTTIPSGASYVRVSIKISNPDDAEITPSDFVNVQLEAGSTATSYEPYSGGVPGPNPSHPFPIEVCRGRNLIPGFASGTYIGVTLTNDGNGVMLNGTASSGGGIAGEYAELAAGTYTLSIPSAIPSGVFLSINNVSGRMITNGGRQVTFTLTEAERCRLYLWIDSGVSLQNYTLNPQLELGSTPTPYIPYGHVGMEVQGRNLCESIAQGFWNNNGSAVDGNANYVRTNKIHGSGQYCATWVKKCVADVLFWDANGAHLGSSQFANADSCSFETPSGTDVFAIRFYNSNGVTPSQLGDTQVEAGSTAHAYEPYIHHTIPIPLPIKSDGIRWAGAVGDYADALVVDSAGGYAWTNEVEEGVYSSVIQFANGHQMQLAGAGTAKRAASTSTAQSLLCSHLAAGTADATYNGTDDAAAISPGGYIYACVRSITTESDANTWLAANHLTILYPKPAPTTESGYIQLPLLSNGATVSIPELDNLNISWIIESCSPLIQMNQTAPHFQWVVDNEDTWLAIIA